MRSTAPFWSPSQTLAVLFDWDGIIAETHLDFSGIREKYYGGRRAMLLEEAHTLPAERQRELMRDLEEIEMQGAFLSTPVPGISDVLRWVRDRHIPWAVVSRNCRKSIETAAEQIGIELPTIVRSRDDGDCVKPEPEALLQTCRQLGVSPYDTLFIGDFIYDMIGARRCGMRGVLVRDTIDPSWEPWLECAYTSMHTLHAELLTPTQMVPWEYLPIATEHGRDFLIFAHALSAQIPETASPDLATWVLQATACGVGTFVAPDMSLSPDMWRHSPAFDVRAMGAPLSLAASRLLERRFPLARVTDTPDHPLYPLPADADAIKPALAAAFGNLHGRPF